MSTWDKQKVLGMIRLEIDNIRRQGFRGYFRDSVLCINTHKLLKSDTCEGCALLLYVPQEHKGEAVPCVHITLDAGGDTVASLSKAGLSSEIEQKILDWLERTADNLEHEILAERVKRLCPNG